MKTKNPLKPSIKPPAQPVKVPERAVKPVDLLQVAITPELDVKPDHAIVNGVFHRIVKAVGYPRKVEDCWLGAFLAASEPYDISLHVHPASINSTLVLLHNQIVKQTTDLASSTMKGTPNPSLEIKLADTTRVYEELYKGEEKLFRVSLYIDCQAQGLDKLDLLTEKCKANMNAALIIPKTVDYRMADGIKSMLAEGVDALSSQKEFLTSSLSATFPFLYPVDSSKQGLFFGHEHKTLNPLFIDFGKMSNKHFFVLGISGAGKSYAAKFLVTQQLLAQKAKVFILDPNAEYTGLASKMKGEVVKLSKDSDSIINLFDLAGEDFGDKMLTLISVFDIITGGLTESQKGILNQALTEVYRQKGIDSHKPASWGKNPPTFSDLRQVLLDMVARFKGKDAFWNDEQSAQSLLNRVLMYSEGGFFEFLDKPTRMDLRNDFVDFDLSELPSQVKQLVMFLVLELISREIRKDKEPKVVLIDEGWSLLRSKEAENYILEFIKTSRKYNASIGFITQEIEDLLRSDGGKSILNTTSTKILLRQNSSNLGLIAKILCLNEEERNFLLRAEKGHGLLITEQGRYEFAINAPPKIHDLITTDPSEICIRKRKVEPEEEELVSLREFKGYYESKLLTSRQKEQLRKEGYVMKQSHLLSYGGGKYYFIKKYKNESAEHAILCWAVDEEIRKNGGKPTTSPTVDADVTVMHDGRKICFEIETGEHLRFDGSEGVLEKMERRKKLCDDLFIVVTDRSLKPKYQAITGLPVLTRTEVSEAVRQALGGGARQVGGQVHASFKG